MSHTSLRLVLRCAVVLSGVTVVAGCGTGLPQLRPGSNVTLPRTPESQALRALLLPCETTVDATDRARALVDCKRSLLDPTQATNPQGAGPARTTP